MISANRYGHKKHEGGAALSLGNMAEPLLGVALQFLCLFMMGLVIRRGISFVDLSPAPSGLDIMHSSVEPPLTFDQLYGKVADLEWQLDHANRERDVATRLTATVQAQARTKSREMEARAISEHNLFLEEAKKVSQAEADLKAMESASIIDREKLTQWLNGVARLKLELKAQTEARHTLEGLVENLSVQLDANKGGRSAGGLHLGRYVSPAVIGLADEAILNQAMRRRHEQEQEREQAKREEEQVHPL